VLISLFVLVTVPVVAMVVAYGYGNGEPLTNDAWKLARDVADVLGLR
jgi:multisubunit Na+/H+ antiporter MnhG subunit